VLGDWVPGDDGMFHFPPSGSKAPTNVQSISIWVNADSGRIEQLVGAVDFAALQALKSGNWPATVLMCLTRTGTVTAVGSCWIVVRGANAW